MYGWVRARYEAKLRRSNFVSAPWAGGVVLLVCVVVAMLLANLPFILIQRYNRPRLVRLAALLQKREQRKGNHESSDTDL